MFPMYGVGHGGFGMLLGSLWFLLVIGVVVAIVVSVARTSTPRGTPAAPPVSPETGYPASAPQASLEVVRQRYARGEIDETELNRILENLRSTGLR